MLKAIPSMSFVLSPSITFHPLLQIYRALIITCIGCSTFSTALPEQPSPNWKVNAETFMWPRKHHRTPSLGLSRRSSTGTSSMQFNCHCMDADLHLPCIMGRINKFKLMNQAPDRSASASRIEVDAHHIRSLLPSSRLTYHVYIVPEAIDLTDLSVILLADRHCDTTAICTRQEGLRLYAPECSGKDAS